MAGLRTGTLGALDGAGAGAGDGDDAGAGDGDGDDAGAGDGDDAGAGDADGDIPACMLATHAWYSARVRQSLSMKLGRCPLRRSHSRASSSAAHRSTSERPPRVAAPTTTLQSHGHPFRWAHLSRGRCPAHAAACPTSSFQGAPSSRSCCSRPSSPYLMREAIRCHQRQSQKDPSASIASVSSR